eukprot:Opistho-2@94927
MSCFLKEEGGSLRQQAQGLPEGRDGLVHVQPGQRCLALGFEGFQLDPESAGQVGFAGAEGLLDETPGVACQQGPTAGRFGSDLGGQQPGLDRGQIAGQALALQVQLGLGLDEFGAGRGAPGLVGTRGAEREAQAPMYSALI